MKILCIGHFKKDLWSVAKAIFFSAVAMIVVVSIVQKIFEDFHDTVKNFFEVLWPAVLNCSFVTESTYRWAAFLVGVFLSLYICLVIFKKLVPKIIIRNREYILKLFAGRGDNSPIPTRKALIEKIYGETKNVKNSEDFKFINEMISKNIFQISAFMNSKNTERILCVDGKWGSGKTTSLLIAINECKAVQNRYIYEAAFKYCGNIREFINDVLVTFGDAMAESGTRTKNAIELLAANYDTDFKKTVINLLRYRRDLDVLTSDFVLKLNNIYERKGCKNKFFIIIDDLDRLQGEGIIEVLSFLSMLRNLNFVKIIVPVDLEIVYKALKVCDVIDPPKFIAKYLPYSASAQINSGYEMTEKILENKIAQFYKKNKQMIDFKPAIAAIYIGMLAETMLNETRYLKNYRYKWLRVDTQGTIVSPPQRQEVPEGPLTEKLSQLLQVPNIISKQSNGEYDWCSWYNNIKKFQNVVYALRVEDSSSGKRLRVAQMFSEGEYAMISNWVFSYMEKRWNIFEFTIRDAINILDKVEYDNLPKDPIDQFICVFNQLFPDEKLKVIDKTGKKES